ALIHQPQIRDNRSAIPKLRLFPETQHNRPADDRFAKTPQIRYKRITGREKIVCSHIKESNCAIFIIADLVRRCCPPARPLESLVEIEKWLLGVQLSAGLQWR